MYFSEASFKQLILYLYQRLLLSTPNQEVEISFLMNWIGGFSDIDQEMISNAMITFNHQKSQSFDIDMFNEIVDEVINPFDLSREMQKKLFDGLINTLNRLIKILIMQGKKKDLKPRTGMQALLLHLLNLILNTDKKHKKEQQSYPKINGFKINNLLGEGANAKVYLALNIEKQSVCALKVGVLENRTQFEREVKLMKELSHPNVLKCFESSTYEDQGILKYWISMENMGGVTVEDLILKENLELESKLLLLNQILAGLCALHEKKIIHRDIKPNNCLIDHQGKVVLSDFGLSTQIHMQDQQALNQTLPFDLIGTPAYMSPEQAKGERALISFQSDVWSFGMIIYEILVGDLPWGRTINYFQMIGNIQHVSVPLVKLNTLNMPDLKMVIEKCLNREIEARFENALVLKVAFDQAIAMEQVRRKNVILNRTQDFLRKDKVLERYFELMLYEGKDISVIGLWTFIKGIRMVDDLDFDEVQRMFQIAEKVICDRYLWKEKYLQVLAQNLEMNKHLEKKKASEIQSISLAFKEKMNLVEVAELHLKLTELQAWQQQEMSKIESLYQREVHEIGKELKDMQKRFGDILNFMSDTLSSDLEKNKINTKDINIVKKENKKEDKGKNKTKFILLMIFLLMISGISFFIWYQLEYNKRWKNDLFGIHQEEIKANTQDWQMEEFSDEKLEAQLQVLDDFEKKLYYNVNFIPIKGGSFMMGSHLAENEQPVHWVFVRDFEMSKTEVTVGQYWQCIQAGVCSFPHWDDGSCYIWNGTTWNQGILGREFRNDAQPLVCVDWIQAKVFAKWVGGDLPSEAQWEYASRSGGQNIKYPWGNEEASCSHAVMWNGNSNGCGRYSTWAVCSKLLGNTTQGLCDMSGNVWEWMRDEYHDSYNNAPSDDTAWCSDRMCSHNNATIAVNRGGSWSNGASYLRSVNRTYYHSGLRSAVLGFRVARPAY